MSKNNVLFKQIRFCDKNSNYRTYYTEGRYLDYITRDEAVLEDGTTHVYNINELRMYSDQELLELRQKFKDLNPKQLVWDFVISIDKEFADKHAIRMVDDFGKIIHDPLEDFFKKNKLKMENMEIFGAMHHNTDNPHIHICFFEKQELYTDKEGHKQFKRFGTLGGSDVIKLKEFGRAVEHHVDTDILNKSLRECREQLYKRVQEKFEKNYIDDFSELVSYFVENNINKFRYKSLDLKTQEKVMDCVNRIIESDPSLSFIYVEYRENLLGLKHVNEKLNDVYKLDQKYSDDLDKWFKLEAESINIRCANSILNSIKNGVFQKTGNQKQDEENDQINDELFKGICLAVNKAVSDDIQKRVKKARFNKNPGLIIKPIKNAKNYSKFNRARIKAEQNLKRFLKQTMQKNLDDAIKQFKQLEKELFNKNQKQRNIER